MKLIAGLGNPGPRYAASRHNIGYLVVDELARRWRVDVSRPAVRFDGLLGETQQAGETLYLLKPTTFMNLSGQSVGKLWRYYKLTLPDLLVIYDDLDLPVGQVRLRAAGSAGGHKGMSDVLRHIGSDQIARIRIGISKVNRAETVEHVLGRFAPDEQPLIDDAVQRAADAVAVWLRRGIEFAMNEFNRRRQDDTAPGAASAQGDES